MEEVKHNLFVYGSLRESSVFKSVCGLSFVFNSAGMDETSLLAEPAILTGYRRVTPDNVYYYAVEDPIARIEGFVIYDLPTAALDDVDRYEGKRYDRDTVKVVAARGTVEAFAYLANRKAMRKHFGDRFHVNLIHELWLRKRIERFLEKHTRPGETSIDADIERRADRELVATTERDLVISHYRAKPVSDFFIEHELARPRPSIRHLYDDPQACQFIENYIVLVLRQVILNQFETKIRERYRHRIEHLRIADRYYNLSLSLLTALRMMNANAKVIDILVQECLNTMPYPDHDLIDYVKFAVAAADGCFTWQLPRDILDRVTVNLQRGLVPLGAEIELSNLGYRAVPPHSSKVTDCVYDNFRYFHDFELDVLSWKVGGYIDDHMDPSRQARSSGFFECAPGRLNAERELSRPATSDPWLLNQLIHEMMAFYQVMPHSLHLSFQVLKSQIGKQKPLPVGFVRCLFALGGGLEKRDDGGYFISRMANNEIVVDKRGEELVFSRTSKRQWYLGEDEDSKAPTHATTWVKQYKFIRLDSRTNYEPLILALKGIQISCNPGDYLTSEQLQNDPALRDEYAQLKEWAADPQPIGSGTVADFMDAVREGLMSEAHGRPAHKLHYIQWAISSLRAQLQMFNKKVAEKHSTRNLPMTPRQIILANIEHTSPPRCGMTFSNGRIDDIVVASVSDPEGYRPGKWVEGNREYYGDVWGNVWARMVGGSEKGEIHKAVLDDWADLDKLKVPDYTHDSQYARMKEEFAKAGDKFRLAFMGGWVFNDARYIRKLEVYLCDMALCPDELKRLHKTIAAVYEAKIRGAAKAGADGIWVLEDLGTQNGPLFSPQMFRDYFKDEYARLWGIAHELGMKVFMHSCGNNTKLLDDLIEAGVDCFQFDQPLVYDIEMLAEKFRKNKVALWSPVDIQKVLPTGDRELIVRETERMLRVFKDGLIMKNYPDLPGIGVKPEWDMWAYDTAARSSSQ